MITEMEYVVQAGDSYLTATIQIDSFKIRVQFPDCVAAEKAAALMESAYIAGKLEATRLVSEDILARLREWRPQ